MSAARLAAWLVLAALPLAWAAAGSSRAAEEAPGPALERGGELYAVHCARCHAADGQGREGIAPPLRDVPIAAVDLVLRTGRMPPGDPAGRTKGPIRWPAEDREALVAYLTRSFGLEGAIDPPPPGDAARGREVFATHCAQCHGYTGAGGVAGAGAFTPEVTGLDPATIAQAIRIGPFEMPRFSADLIDDEAVGDVAIYLDEVAHEEGTPLDLVELNPVYASALVAVLALVVVLSCLWIAGRVRMFPDRPDPDGEGPA